MPVTLSPRDRIDRERATTTFDRNVVVTAGAGTGKTTLLVDRLVHLLMREPDPLRITDIVALTFTNKAANEMRERLRVRLESYVGSDSTSGGADPVGGDLEDFQARYRLTRQQIDTRAREALRYLERSEIGTIHSFAASLLRLYPLEASLDPRFREDEGDLFAEHFESSWTLWLDEELSGHGPRTAVWERLLRRFSLDQIRELALGFCSESLDLDRVGRGAACDHTNAALGQWLSELVTVSQQLVERYPGERRVEQTLRIAAKVLLGAMHGDAAGRVTRDERRSLDSVRPVASREWDAGDFAQARELIRIARALLEVDHCATDELVALLVPFARLCREAFGREGIVTFDGLLVRARNLLRDYPRVRHQLKSRFKAVLVDEFQDTDPLQYEILLFLCEDLDQSARQWQNIVLVPGKVFVVGDPKQSIYAFRGADIAAYLHVVQDVIRAQNGVECRLTTNFRSQAAIVRVVNGAFERLFEDRRGLQPEYIAIDPGHGYRSIDSGPGVTLRKVRCSAGTDKADNVRRSEAESLADWLAKEVIGRIRIHTGDGREIPAQPGHVAYLMRSLTHVQTYLEPLRKRGIGYVVEGERSFYATQEVVDAVNLFRAIDNPHDRLALAGVLRSPLGGQNDLELFALSRRHLLDYRLIASPRWVDLPRSVAGLYQRLHRLHREARTLAVEAAVARIFADLPVAVLAASTFAGEQATANLEKVREIAAELGGRGPATLKEVVAELERRVRQVKQEPESPLDEETLDAVKVMSIHKAKGLEFPIVVIVDAAASVERRRRTPAEVKEDWCTGLVGLRLGDARNLSDVFVDARRRAAEKYERVRLLYVALTRPATLLVLSCGDKVQRRGESFLSLLDDATGRVLESEPAGVVPCGAGEITVEAPVAALEHRWSRKHRTKDATEPSDWSSYAERWRRRRDRHAELRNLPLFVTPTALGAAEPAPVGEARPEHGIGLARDQALLLGEVTHRILEMWDFRTGCVEADLDAALSVRLPGVPEVWRDLIEKEIRTIWAAFTCSAAYRELSAAHILGREIPFLMPWGKQIMEGVIDVLYELDGGLYAADYKTDRVGHDEIEGFCHRYRHQAEIYTKAVERSLGREVAEFKLILLRLGEAVSAERSQTTVRRSDHGKEDHGTTGPRDRGTTTCGD